MRSKQLSKSDDTFRKAKKAVDEIINLRPMALDMPSSSLPVFFSPSPLHAVDPMLFKVGEISDTPFEGVCCMGISITKYEIVVVCEVLHAIRFEAHQHGEWEEKLIMETGVLYEHRTGEVYRPGEGVYHQMPGQIHEPEFLTPSRCMITWSRGPALSD